MKQNENKEHIPNWTHVKIISGKYKSEEGEVIDHSKWQLHGETFYCIKVEKGDVFYFRWVKRSFIQRAYKQLRLGF